MWDLVRNSEDRFSHNEAQYMYVLYIICLLVILAICNYDGRTLVMILPVPNHCLSLTLRVKIQTFGKFKKTINFDSQWSKVALPCEVNCFSTFQYLGYAELSMSNHAKPYFEFH